ncbi:MAG: hypothetical protein JWN39_1237 [Ilumatobacteraceae bacterium]|nr:hypothetical protein [Ilumatobacteraceae bacterium]
MRELVLSIALSKPAAELVLVPVAQRRVAHPNSCPTSVDGHPLVLVPVTLIVTPRPRCPLLSGSCTGSLMVSAYPGPAHIQPPAPDVDAPRHSVRTRGARHSGGLVRLHRVTSLFAQHGQTWRIGLRRPR